MSNRGVSRFAPVVLLAGLLTWACSSDLTSPRPDFNKSTAPGQLNAAQHRQNLPFCTRLGYMADTAVIGPTGGVLHIGPHRLVIPAGALPHPTTIIGDAPSDTVRTVRLFPSGLVFTHDAVLTLSYAGCHDNAEHGLSSYRIAYTDDSLNVLYFLPSVDHPWTHKVSAPIGHFSRYAVGW